MEQIVLASMRPGRFHPGNRDNRRIITGACSGFNEAGAFPPRKSQHGHIFGASRQNRFNEAGAFPPRKSDLRGHYCAAQWHASMRPGRFHPGNRVKPLAMLSPTDASMRPGRFHPGNSPFGTPCAAWVFHPFCERWPLCLLEHANCSPNAYHNTTYLLVIQIESALRELPAFFFASEHSQGTRQMLR